jgi:hypothetical protein
MSYVPRQTPKISEGPRLVPSINRYELNEWVTVLSPNGPPCKAEISQHRRVSGHWVYKLIKADKTSYDNGAWVEESQLLEADEAD